MATRALVAATPSREGGRRLALLWPGHPVLPFPSTSRHTNPGSGPVVAGPPRARVTNRHEQGAAWHLRAAHLERDKVVQR